MENERTILVVDDEEKIRELVCKYARFSGYRAECASNGMEAVEKCRNGGYDLVIMDIMMPELDGFSAVREIRKTSSVPVIMLSARGEDYDKISGFELGADDYVTKPFSPKELMLRCEAIFRRTERRSESRAKENDVYVFEGLTVDMSARSVSADGRRLELSPKEYDLLFYFVKNRGLALERRQIIDAVWGYDYYGGDRTLDTHVKLLRKNLGAYCNRITTLRGVGYRFEK